MRPDPDNRPVRLARSPRSGPHSPTSRVRGALGVLLVLALASWPVPAFAGTVRPEALEASLDSVLAGIILDGRVDYRALQANPAPLDRWLERTAALRWTDVREWTRPTQLAFYLNVWNARLIASVRDRVPIHGMDPTIPPNSVAQIPEIWTAPFKVAGQQSSLEGLERDILWADFKEPLVRFGLVRAALGSPPLREGAFHGETCFGRLTTTARDFLADSTRVLLRPAEHRLVIPGFFARNPADFSSFVPPTLRAHRQYAGCLVYLSNYLAGPGQAFVLSGDYELEIAPFDWTLNDRP